MAAVLAGLPLPPPFAASVRSDVAIALTRSPDLIAALQPYTNLVLAHDPAPPPGQPAADWLATPVRDLGLDVSLSLPALVFTDDEQHAARMLAAGLHRGFVALHPGSGSPGKRWPGERFRALALRLAEGRPWLLVTGAADADVRAELAGTPGAVPVHAAPLRILGALLARAGIVVGNDSGVSHLAAASGAPTLALFGPTDPATWSPLGPAVATLRSPDGTMSALDLATVEDAARRLLARARSAASEPPSG
jgi:ADP-heptose:LPS heptosyltransferase